MVLKGRADGIEQDIYSLRCDAEPFHEHLLVPIGDADNSAPRRRAGRIGQRHHDRLVMSNLCPQNERHGGWNSLAIPRPNIGWPVQFDGDGLCFRQQVLRKTVPVPAADAGVMPNVDSAAICRLAYFR